MSVMSGRRGLMESLKAEGVRYLFGNPGSSELPIMEELERHPELDYVLVMQEGVGMGMADALARVTGKPSFVSLHIETGLANGISLLHNANQGSTPLVLSSANRDIRQLAQGRTDLAGMVRQFTKFAAEVTHPDQVSSIMRRAFNEARTPPMGPTFVGFSANALDGMADLEIGGSVTGCYRVPPDRSAIEDAVRALAQANNPILLLGDRVAQTNAVNEAVDFAELVGARVYCSSFTEVNFPMNHPQFHGGVGIGSRDAREKLSKGDVVVAVGVLSTYGQLSSSPEMLLLDLDPTFIHIDVDPTEIGKIQPTDVGMISDPKVSLREIVEALDAEMTALSKEAAKGRVVKLSAEKELATESWNQLVKSKWNTNPMSDIRMVSELAASLPDDTVIIGDAITTRTAINNVFQFDKPGSFYGMVGGAIGWGLGGAMGVKLAYPDRPVVAIVGDGSAMMTVQAFWTAAARNIASIFVIVNNGSYKVLKGGMDRYKHFIKEDTPSKYIGMDFPTNLNIAGLAEKMGITGHIIRDPLELKPVIRKALDSGKPAVLDVMVD